MVFMLFMQTADAQGSKKNKREHGVEDFPELNTLLSGQQKTLGNDVVALVWKDTILFKKEMGEMGIKNDAPLALASQWLTAAMIMVLVDEGKLSLDDKVADYLPIFSTYGKNYITIRHCLTHFTGIRAGEKLMEGKFESLETEAASYAKKEIQTNPGTEFRYSSAGMTIAGRIIEVVTKRRFDQVIKQRLFNPMKMTKTSFSTMDGSGLNPATGARSNASDMIRFLQMLLNNGNLEGKQILSETSVKEMRKIHAMMDDIKYAPKAAKNFAYTMGSWAVDGKGEEASVISSPGMYGVWPVVDWCRSYVMIVMTKEIQSEQKMETFEKIREAVEEQIKPGSGCN